MDTSVNINCEIFEWAVTISTEEIFCLYIKMVTIEHIENYVETYLNTTE